VPASTPEVDMPSRRIRPTILRSGLLALLLAGVATVVVAANVRFQTQLLSTNELQSADSDGHGHANVSVDVASGQVCFDVAFQHSGTPNRAHIHAGDAATNGPIVVTFFELRENAADPRHDELEQRGRHGACVLVTNQALLEDIAANPDSYYVNLHNARFPAGSMRGQLDD
jgi:hypothetical protein